MQCSVSEETSEESTTKTPTDMTRGTQFIFDVTCEIVHTQDTVRDCSNSEDKIDTSKWNFRTKVAKARTHLVSCFPAS